MLKPLMGLAFGIILLVVISVTNSVGAKITDDVGNGLTGTAKDAALNGTLTMATVSTWQPTVGTILIAGSIIAMLFGLFFIFGRSKGGM